MCDEIHIEGHGYVRRLSALADALGGRDKVVVMDGYPELPENCCLCPVDLGATLGPLGLTSEWDEGVLWVTRAESGI